jgi:hypothetical protein
MPHVKVKSVWIKLAIFVSGGMLSACALAADIAGTVSFVAGDARVEGANGQFTALAAGAKINVGEAIATGTNGHVYINMIDSAFVVVRPQSKLRVDDYRYDANVPANNRVKFSLEQGVVRSVTGRAGQASKENYRLNTPMAAIGIRGTDFVVQAGSDVTRVAVQSGSIVMSPLAVDCLASAFGPCSSATARVLTAAMRDAYLELRSRNEAPRLVPGEKAIESPNLISPPRPEEPRTSADKQSKGGSDTDSRDVIREVNAGVIKNNVNQPAQAPTPPPIVIVEAPAQFWWGRWSTYVKSGSEGSFTSILLPGRELAFTNDVFGVVREPGNVVMPNSGVANFKLAESEAFIVKGPTTVSSAQITAPSLKIDFGSRRYETALTVKGADTDALAIQSSGKVSFQGLFIPESNSANTTINGALSKTSEQAAYVFQRDLPGGISAVGATRWTH